MIVEFIGCVGPANVDAGDGGGGASLGGGRRNRPPHTTSVLANKIGQGGIVLHLINAELLIGLYRTFAVICRSERRFCGNFVALDQARTRAYILTATRPLRSAVAAVNVASAECPTARAASWHPKTISQ
jgi:hypothetical protein